MLLIGLIILLLGLGFVLLPCLRCVRASSTRAPSPMRVVPAFQVEKLSRHSCEAAAAPVRRTPVRAASTLQAVSDAAPNVPRLFSMLRSASRSLGQKGSVGIGTSSPAGTLDVEGGTAAASTGGSDINLIAQSAGTGNEDGGNIILMPGAATGTGTPGYVGIVFTCPFFRSSIGAISRATKRAFQNFRTQAKRHRNRAQGGGSPRAAPFLVTV